VREGVRGKLATRYRRRYPRPHGLTHTHATVTVTLGVTPVALKLV
jgi:hypothetical protein